MATLDPTARAKRDPVDFLMSVYDRLDDAFGVAADDYDRSPQGIIHRCMDDLVRAELAASGIRAYATVAPLPIR